MCPINLTELVGGNAYAAVNLRQLRRTKPLSNDRELMPEIIRVAEHEILHHGIMRATRRKIEGKKSDWAIEVMQRPDRWLLKKKKDHELQTIRNQLRDAKTFSDQTKLRKVLTEMSLMLRRVRQDLARLRKLTLGSCTKD